MTRFYIYRRDLDSGELKLHDTVRNEIEAEVKCERLNEVHGECYAYCIGSDK